MNKPSIFAIFIAYNAAKTLRGFYESFPKELFDEIILVDDASSDGTYELAKSLGLRAYRNEVNLGYGGNMKRALSIGLKLGGDVFVDIHPDGEYKPGSIPNALEEVHKGAQLVLGNRFSKWEAPLQSGMYFWKFIPILLLNKLTQLFLQTDIADAHQGFRVYTRRLLEGNSFERNSNDYLFSFELIAQAVLNRVKISQVAVATNYTGKKRGATLKKSVLYTLGTFKIVGQFWFAKLGIKSKIFDSPKVQLETRIISLLPLGPLLSRGNHPPEN